MIAAYNSRNLHFFKINNIQMVAAQISEVAAVGVVHTVTPKDLNANTFRVQLTF
jgi:hypothetical protein